MVERALSLPGADAHPTLRVRALRAKANGLWQMGRIAEASGVLAEAETAARELDDPALLTQALRMRVAEEINAERLEVAEAVADEALRWARATGDEWETAQAFRGKAIAASNLADLRERVDRAASLLTGVGDTLRLADLLTSAAYAALCLGSTSDAADFAARAAPISRALDGRVPYMINCGNLGLAMLFSGETDAASNAFREEIALCREMVVRPVVFEGLRGLAAVAVARGDPGHAATLLGAAAAHRYGAPPDPVEAMLEETFFKPARARCGADAWTAAFRQGRTLSFEDAIACALEQPIAPVRTPHEQTT